MTKTIRIEAGTGAHVSGLIASSESWRTCSTSYLSRAFIFEWKLTVFQFSRSSGNTRPPDISLAAMSIVAEIVKLKLAWTIRCDQFTLEGGHYLPKAIDPYLLTAANHILGSCIDEIAAGQFRAGKSEGMMEAYT